MRLLQLNPNGNDSSALDFHPMVTVVTDLGPGGRTRVIQALSALPTGQDPGCNGLLEAHGILLDLSVDTLSLLGLDTDLDVLISLADIPGAHSGGAASGIMIGGQSLSADSANAVTSALPQGLAPLSVDDFLAITPEGEYPELDERLRAQHQATEARDIFREAFNRARGGHEEAKVRTRVAEVALEQARQSTPRANLRLVTDEFEPDRAEPDDPASADATWGERDPDDDESSWSPGSFGDDGLGAGFDTGSEMPAETEEEALAALATRRDELLERQTELQAQIDKIDRGIGELAALDPRPIQVLLDAIQNPPPVEMGPSRRGHELADEFVRLQAEVQVLEESLDARGLGSTAAMTRLEQTRLDLANAEKAIRPPEFTDTDRMELESAHDEVLEAEPKGRRGGGKKRLDEALAKEQQILDRMGFPTWSSYVMGASLMGIDPAAEQRLEKARFEYEAAEAHWSDVAAMIEADPVHRELLDKLEAVYLEAFDMLGGDDEQDDIEIRLRSLQEPQRDVSVDELVDALAYQLELVGIGLPAGSATLDRTVMVAEAFMEEASAIVDRLNELGSEKVEALTDLQGVEQVLDELPTDEATSERVRADIARVEQQAADIAAGIATAERLAEDARLAEEEAERLEAITEEDRAALERALEVAVEEEAEHLELVEARQALLDHAIQAETIATSQVKKLAIDLAAAAVAQGVGTPLGDAGAEAPVPAEADLAPGVGFGDESQGGPEAIEFYLLARLAALRSASFAGSVPLVIDDALAGLPEAEIQRLLHKLERMSESVQIVYLSDDPAVAAWAEGVGFERAAVVSAPSAFA